ncbi:hypothetical protein G7K_2288-t1 [Saitoella complicata NRRL Y-17804]|uniref:Uncharacterized protein n=1 Tax=Saitoella complicata (strain BCRC 22490 / CBS 7301 / JCM 7358 / NBRC 10748 / NRRL Y-17804) TaxID=698492 RepID=A0A0E9NEI0_SAICN|nr:hypothetical protein G7K_2288-t1 [Saitoella complicata NRRL Y-17804]
MSMVAQGRGHVWCSLSWSMSSRVVTLTHVEGVEGSIVVGHLHAESLETLGVGLRCRSLMTFVVRGRCAHIFAMTNCDQSKRKRSAPPAKPMQRENLHDRQRFGYVDTSEWASGVLPAALRPPSNFHHLLHRYHPLKLNDINDDDDGRGGEEGGGEGDPQVYDYEWEVGRNVGKEDL